MWNARDRGVSEMNHHESHQRLVFIQKVMYIWWDGKGVLYYEFLLANQMINYKYCSQLKQWKAALNKNHLELVNRKHNLLSG